MKHNCRLFFMLFWLMLALSVEAQPYFQATATITMGNKINFIIKAVNGNITCGWSDIEFFFRNPTGSPTANSEFTNAVITINTTDFAGVIIPYNGMNQQGSEVGYNNYWFGTSFTATTPKTYNQGQEYTICTITLSSSPSAFDLELCHNEPNFTPHYVALTDEGGNDKSNLTGTNKFYGPGATICTPVNCPASTDGNNHILPLDGVFPVKLIDFQAKKLGKKDAQLFWNTSIEIDFFAFEIERQKGDQWEKIGVEKARAENGSGASYSFLDNNVNEDVAYYRLKMLDTDGSFEYSLIRSVRFGNENSLSIFPNPAKDVLNIQFGKEIKEEEMQIELYDANGRVVLNQNMVATPGILSVLSLRKYHLPTGVYMFKAVSASGFQFAQSIVISSEP